VTRLPRGNRSDGGSQPEHSPQNPLVIMHGYPMAGGEPCMITEEGGGDAVSDGLPIRTERLALDRFRIDDAGTLAAYRSQPDVARYQGWTAPVTPEQARALAADFAAGDPERPGWFQYAIRRGRDGILIGDTGVRLHDNRMQAELGFTLAGEHQGQGYATEAVGRLLVHLFAERGLHRVSAECDARNERSMALLRRLGFRQEGYRPANSWIKGEWTDDVLFGLLAADFRP
jgi:RimJ/RimL family protein N-acetyltransferase